MHPRTAITRPVATWVVAPALLGGFSNFYSPAIPIAADPWTFAATAHLYQAAKFAARADI